MKLLGLILSAALLSGCAASGFNRGALQKQIGIVDAKFDDADIKKAYDKKSALPKPFKLGVFFKTSPDANWRWSEQDKAFVTEELVKELKKDGLIADVFPIANSIVTDEDLKALRMAAAKHGADALLVVGGGAQVDKYINNWGWTYALIVPAFFVPGSKADTLFMANASLWDVRNEYLYLTAQSESTKSRTYIAAFGRPTKELIGEAKTEAMSGLKGELAKMIKGTKL